MLVPNPFTRKASDYTRDINIIDSAINQQAIILSRCTGVDYHSAREYVVNDLKSEESTYRDPIIQFLEQDEHEDRHLKTMPFSGYLRAALTEDLLMAPTFTQIIPPKRKESLLSQYIKVNLEKRNIEKKLQLQAANHNETFKESLHKQNQNNKKTLNNAISGNHRSVFSILYDKPVHPILTSCCRIANGSANSNNDRLLMGNRHYYTPDIVLANIASIIELSDWPLVEEAITKHNMHIPSVQEVLDVIAYSTSLYWIDDSSGPHPYILDMVNGLSDLERAAVVYMGDLYHMAKFNRNIVRDILDSLVNEPTVPVENHNDWLAHADTDTLAQVVVRFPNIIGREHPFHESVMLHPEYWKLGTMVHQIYTTLDHYKAIINAFLMSRNVPFLISDFPHAIRKAGVGSDTDSAIFTVAPWTIWYNGNDDVNYDNILLAEAMAFIVSETTTHNLATMTVNMGVTDPKEVFRLSMKNEYLFIVFMLTSRAKHYAALQKVQEGVIFDKPKLEKKGVELIASNSPKGVRDDLERLIRDALDKQSKGILISLHEYLVVVAQWEHQIYDSIASGETTYLKSARIKEEEGYTLDADKSKYINYTMWEQIWSNDFGHSMPPPYSALGFSIIPDTKTKTTKWLSEWEDQSRADKMRAFLSRYNKEKLGEILMPEENIMIHGIPPEVLSVINIRKIVFKAVSPFYLFLESFEFYLQDKYQNKLVMDFISKEDIERYFINKASRPD